MFIITFLQFFFKKLAFKDIQEAEKQIANVQVGLRTVEIL